MDRYYANPNHCRECGELIPVPNGIKVQFVRVKRFCNRSCANRFNNREVSRRRPKGYTGSMHRRASDSPNRIKPSTCVRCGRTTYSRDGRRKFCVDCYKLFRFPGGVRFADLTKGDLFARRSNWQSARNSIRLHAQQTFIQSGRPAECFVCKYATHVDIAHRRAVSDFPETTTMKEINDISNLVPLCPNHHWELDHGLLQLPPE